MSYHHNDPERELFKFYDRVRLHLDDLDLEKDDTHKVQSYDQRSCDKPSEAELFGFITKDEFIKVLNSYDEQQRSQNLQDKPVACDKIVGGNYAKLLYSKPGFHHLNSTSHLVKSLEIRNIHRSSFLVGHSTFCANKDEEISGLKETQKNMLIKQITDRAIEYINSNQLDLACKEINRAYNLDSRNGDVLATRGRYYMAKNDHVDAIKFFKSALNHKPHDENNIRFYLSDSLYQQGVVQYNRTEYKKARDLLSDALKYNLDNQGAKLHKNLCEDRLRAATSFSNKHPAYRK